jgi:hypothetical protein
MSINTSKLAKEMASNIESTLQDRLGRHPAQPGKSFEELVEAYLETQLDELVDAAKEEGRKEAGE